MSTSSILNASRHQELLPAQRVVVGACERTTHDCAMETWHGCLERLPIGIANSAAIVGLFSALCRIISETQNSRHMVSALTKIMQSEVDTWTREREGRGLR